MVGASIFREILCDACFGGRGRSECSKHVVVHNVYLSVPNCGVLYVRIPVDQIGVVANGSSLRRFLYFYAARSREQILNEFLYKHIQACCTVHFVGHERCGS